jgi:hypothetical protein
LTSRGFFVPQENDPEPDRPQALTGLHLVLVKNLYKQLPYIVYASSGISDFFTSGFLA